MVGTFAFLFVNIKHNARYRLYKHGLSLTTNMMLEICVGLIEQKQTIDTDVFMHMFKIKNLDLRANCRKGS